MIRRTAGFRWSSNSDGVVGRRELLPRLVCRKRFPQVRRRRIARMNDDPETESQRLPRLDGQTPVPAFIFEIVQSENVGGEETVVARMPVGRKSRIIRV